MSIISRISAATAVLAFGLLALGAVSSTGAASPSPTTVRADGHWHPVPQPYRGAPTFGTDDSHVA